MILVTFRIRRSTTWMTMWNSCFRSLRDCLPARHFPPFCPNTMARIRSLRMNSTTTWKSSGVCIRLTCSGISSLRFARALKLGHAKVSCWQVRLPTTNSNKESRTPYARKACRCIRNSRNALQQDSKKRKDLCSRMWLFPSQIFSRSSINWGCLPSRTTSFNSWHKSIHCLAIKSPRMSWKIDSPRI